MATILKPPVAGVINTLTGRVSERHVLAVFRRVERSDFIDSSLWPRAAADSPLPIGFAQTTSQPFVIARMLTMLLNGKRKLERVLEIGAGCGYQTALLSYLCERVIGIERIGDLARAAARRLRTMGYKNTCVVHADGFDGYAAEAPFDGIIVCAAYPEVPELLLQQLSPEGLLVMPLESAGGTCLTAVNAEGQIVARRDKVIFVPMLGGKH